MTPSQASKIAVMAAYAFAVRLVEIAKNVTEYGRFHLKC